MKMNHLQQRKGEILVQYVEQLQRAYTTSRRILIFSTIAGSAFYLVACFTNSFTRITDIVMSIWAICTGVIAMHTDSTRNEMKNMKWELQSSKKNDS